MNKFNLLILIIIIVFFSACKKDDNTPTYTNNVNVKLSGSLNVQITDSTGKNYSNVKLYLFDGFNISGNTTDLGEPIASKTTDAKGYANFGDFNAGNYIIISNYIDINNKKFKIQKVLQIVIGNTSSLKINPTEYVGNIKLKLNINTNNLTDTIHRNNLKIALIDINEKIKSDNRNEVISKAVSIKSFKSGGTVEFDNVPANIIYTAYVYLNNNDTIGAWDDIYNLPISTIKGETYSSSILVNLTDLYNINAFISLSLYYFGNNGTSLIPNVNVVMIDNEDYLYYGLKYADHATILNYAIVSGITNAYGNITFSNIPEYKDYNVYLFYSDTKTTWYNNTISINSSYNNYSVQIDNYSPLGLSK